MKEVELKKLMLLAAMLAMVLVAAAPAFAQDGDGGTINDVNVNQYNLQYTVADCINIAAQYGDNVAVNVQGGQYGINVVSGDDNAAQQGVENNSEQTAVAVGPQAVQYCNELLTTVVNNVDDNGTTGTTTTTTGTTGTTGGGTTTTGGGGTLPATGGVSLLALGAGALLVAGGLVARRVIR